MKDIILIWIIARICLFIIPQFFIPDYFQDFPSKWVRWDAPHYISIAKDLYATKGDEANFIVFFPLLPLFIKYINTLINNYSYSAILISLFFSLTASIALYKLTLLDFNKKVALLSVLYLNISPTSYFLQAGYTESLFLTFSILSVYLIRKNKAFYSGLSGLLAGLTRFNAVTLLPYFFYEAKSFKEIFIASFLTIQGTLIYLLINFLTFGDFLYFTKVLENHWYKYLQWPWVGINNLLKSTPGLEQIGIVFVLICGVFIFFKVRRSYGIYVFINLFLFTSTSFILSVPRYALVLFPIYILLAKIKNTLTQLVISSSFISLLIYYTIAYVKGQWAF